MWKINGKFKIYLQTQRIEEHDVKLVKNLTIQEKINALANNPSITEFNIPQELCNDERFPSKEPRAFQKVLLERSVCINSRYAEQRFYSLCWWAWEAEILQLPPYLL